MQPLVGIGGFSIPGEKVRTTETALDELCQLTGFPPGERFKWSPRRSMWMHENLTGDSRRDFFISAIKILADNDANLTVVISDTNSTPATGASSAEFDVVALFMERAQLYLARVATDGVMLVERPSGGRSDEDHFLASCMDVRQSGTDYVRPERLAINVMSMSARFCRCLQAADLVSSASMAHVAGEVTHSKAIFSQMKPLFLSNNGSIGGTGLKLHPDARYLNLYHWILGDTHHVRGNWGRPIPIAGQLYENDEGL